MLKNIREKIIFNQKSSVKRKRNTTKDWEYQEYFQDYKGYGAHLNGKDEKSSGFSYAKERLRT